MKNHESEKLQTAIKISATSQWVKKYPWKSINEGTKAIPLSPFVNFMNPGNAFHKNTENCHGKLFLRMVTKKRIKAKLRDWVQRMIAERIGP